MPLRLKKRLVLFRLTGIIALSVPFFLLVMVLDARAQVMPATEIATKLANKDVVWAALFVAALNSLLSGWLVKTLVDVVQRAITNESKTAEELRQIRHMLGDTRTPQR